MKMKAALAALFIAAVPALQAQSFSEGILNYEVISGTTCRFTGLSEETENLVIPEKVTYNGTSYSVTEVGTNACKDHEEIKTVVVPNSVTLISPNAFYANRTLKEVTLGSGLLTIDRQAFDVCNDITIVRCYAPEPPKAKQLTFTATAQSKATLFVPAEYVDIYKDDFWVWGSFKSVQPIVENVSEFEVDGLSYKVTEGTNVTLTSITSTAANISIPAIINYGGTSFTVTEIGQAAGKDLSTLISLSIPETVTNIGINAFYGCWNMTDLTIGSGVLTINRQAFDACNALTTVKCFAIIPPECKNLVFSASATSKATLRVPEESIKAYENDVMCWGDFNTIIALDAEDPENPINPDPIDPNDPEEGGIKLTGISPSKGSTRSSLSVFKVAFEITEAEKEYNMIFPITGHTSGIRLEREGKDPIYAKSVTSVEDFPVTTVQITFPIQREDGEYTLIIPEGCIGKYHWNNTLQKDELIEGMVNAEIKATYTVSSNVGNIFSDYVMKPATGKSLAAISEIELSFPSAPYALNINNSLPIILSNGTTQYRGDIGGWGNERRLSFSSATESYITVTELGKWTLTIPEGVFSANGEENAEIIAEYTISDDIDFEYKCDPANLSTQEVPEAMITTLSIEFPDASSIVFSPAYDPAPAFTVKYGDKELRKVNNALIQAGYQAVTTAGTNILEIRINTTVLSEPNILTIEAQKGAFKVDGLASPAIDYAVNFGLNKKYDYTLTPAKDGTYESLAKFTVGFPEAKTAVFNENEAFIVLFMLGHSCTEYTCTAVEGAEYPTFDIIFDPAPTFDGEYSFTIDARSFILDKYFYSPIVSGKYTLGEESGVENVSIENENVTVYTLDGRIILQNADRGALSTLSSGLYIVNGRKVYIK